MNQNNFASVVENLYALSDKKHLDGMARFGVNTNYAIGVPVPKLRQLSRVIGKDNKLAEKLWESNIHEARILSSLVADAKTINESQIDKWVIQIDSWDICDSLCGNLIVYTKYAKRKALT